MMKALFAIIAVAWLVCSPVHAQVTNIPCNQLPALTGDATKPAASCATTVTKINGVDQTTAWAAYTPSPSCGTATFTVTSARSKTMGKTTWAELDITITAIGTCTTTLTFTLPNTSNSGGGMIGREVSGTVNGIICGFGAATATANCTHSPGAFGVSEHFVLSGVYENQ